MADDPTAHAIDVMARSIAARAVKRASETLAWEDYPDIGEHDMTRIAEGLVDESARLHQGLDLVQAAYEHLKGRAVMDADSDVNSGPGWYEVIHPTRATTEIVYVHEDGAVMRRWAVDPDYSPETRPADTYQLVYADDRSEIIAANLFHAEASEIAAAHNAEVSARPDVEGRCPACGRESLFLGAGGYVTCREDNCRGDTDE